MQPDTSNTIFQQAVAFVTQTNKHLFLTGKAGTGKTTFLKYIRENCFKKLAVVAPTGVAAINAGGVTIHSFFQLPFGMYVPRYPDAWGETATHIYNTNQLLGNMRLSVPKRELMRELDLLIIDEVSMVRADLLDAMDTVLRAVRRRHHEPFGGVQMLYIGDLFQLPPVVKQAEQAIFSEQYKTPFFFEARAFQEAPPVYIALKKIYRQKDEKFIYLLNQIRNNCCTAQDLAWLHQYYRPDFSPSQDEGYITLSSHNHKADATNREQLERLSSRVHHFEAAINGDFPENSYPVPRVLPLKEGAQIMFVKNDKGEERKYYNGKIGIVQHIEKKKNQIFIFFPGEEGLLELSLETWRNIRYKYDVKKDEIIEEELGTFTQYPVRLAWAITIHKSQGLTFDKAIIDAGASFAPGQVYVALSRLRRLDGLILRSPIHPGNILTDKEVLDFSCRELPEEALKETFTVAQKEYLRLSLLDAFDWKKLLEKTDQFIRDTARRNIPDKREEMLWLNTLKEAVIEQLAVAEKFKVQLNSLLLQEDEKGYQRLHDRTAKAISWFSASLNDNAIISLQDHIKKTRAKPKTKKYVKGLQDVLIAFARKEQQLHQVSLATAGLNQSLDTGDVMARLASMSRSVEVNTADDDTTPLKKVKKVKGETFRTSLELFKEGMSIDEIAATRQLKRSTIEGHLAAFIPTGEIAVSVLLTPDKLKQITGILAADPKVSPRMIREQLGGAVTYAEIKAAMLYREKDSRDA